MVSISAALTDSGIRQETFGFVPFPIENPESLEHYIGREVLCLTTIYDEWNRAKVDILRGRGYNVEVLWERERKLFEGSVVRRLMVVGDPSWREMVPVKCRLFLDDWAIEDRLRYLSRDVV
ncbi:MAG: hypothetical protein HC888_09630 [Candidatus Competibacteraceae bacterium]|nr:hypothetical protein [Candidatus Competibacteraceae bacterium]